MAKKTQSVPSIHTPEIEVTHHIKHNVMEAMDTQDFVFSLMATGDEQMMGGSILFQMLAQPGSSDLCRSP